MISSEIYKQCKMRGSGEQLTNITASQLKDKGGQNLGCVDGKTGQLGERFVKQIDSVIQKL